MRFLKPLLAAAAVLTIAAPAASALAQPYWGGDNHYQRPYDGYDRGDYWRDREARRDQAEWRYHEWRVHQYWAHRRWEEQRREGWGWRY